MISEKKLAEASAFKSDKGHIQGLDFLRAIAALSVCFYHFSGAALPKLTNPYMKPIFSYGWLGVDIFFVISGFIIPYSLFGKNHSLSAFGNYMIKRIIRINPPAYAAMVLVLAQWYFIDYVINHNRFYTSRINWLTILNNITFTVPVTQYKWVIGVFWTLAIEFQFYIFIGIFFKFLFEGNNKWKFIIGYLLVALMQYLPHANSENFLHYSPLFAMGGLTLLYYRGRMTKLQYASSMALFTIVAYFQLNTWIALVGVLTSLAILMTNVENKLFSAIGRISYSFYLIHVLVGNTFEFILVRLVTPNTEFKKILLTILCVIMALASSFMFYNLVERPCIELARRYGKRQAIN
jgi:peptidoglycan/LPS O-acetylase OafA/YrhL